MRKSLTITILCSLFSTLLFAVDRTPPSMTRPFEVTTGEVRRHCPELLGADKDGLDAVEFTGPGRLSVSDEYTCFGNTSYKLDIDGAGKFLVAFKKPFVFESDVSGLEFWLIGTMNKVFPDQRFECTDGNGKHFQLIPNNGCLWGNTSWWASTLAFFTTGTVFPITVNGISFNIGEKAVGNCLYFDTFGAFKRPPVTVPDTRFWLQFPHDPAGISPRPQDANYSNPSEMQEGHTFKYTGSDGNLEYAYTPKTGTLSDLTATIDGKSFFPAKNAGFRAKVGDVVFAPEDTDITATLRAIVSNNNWLRTFWRLEKNGRHLDYELSLSISGRTLTAEFTSDSLAIRSLDAGFIEGVPSPRLFRLANLCNSRSDVNLMVCNDFFVSVLCDWTYSQATALIDDRPYRLEAYGTPRDIEMQPAYAGILGENSARVTGGAIYMPKTDGTRNAPNEKLRITVGPSLESVMPRNPNPQSKYYDETARLIYMTRSYCVGDPASVENEIAMVKLFHDYGARDLFLRYHTELSHVPAFNFIRLSRTFDSCQNFGGSSGLKHLVSSLRKYVKRVGPYENHLAVAGLSADFKFEELSLAPNKEMTWSLRLKPAAMHRAQADFSPYYSRYYGWNGVYYDQMSAIEPWALTDFDADAPGAGRFIEVLRNNCIVTSKLSEHYNGPVWSEGQANHFYAGYLDTGYLQTQHPFDAHIVDYTLREMNAVMHSNGYDLIGQGEPDKGLDFLLASEISLGSMGHIWDGINATTYFGRFRGTPQIWRNALKSYFMLRQLQELYAFTSPEKILYCIDGKEITATEMLRGNHENSAMIHTVYKNGLEVWTNKNKTKHWEIILDGTAITLPPNGYAAFKKGAITEYSALVNGSRIDYSNGPLYTYFDTRDAKASFDGITASGGAFLLEKRDGSTVLIQLPFTKEETVEGLNYIKATPCNQDGQPISAEIPIVNGTLKTQKEHFLYRLMQ